jgi:hypothetical protein
MESDMPMAAPSIDPLAQFLNSVMKQEDRYPIPLVATNIDVTIRGGLAIVTTERTFRNVEKKPIEASLTFPVPVDATLSALSARIDGRPLSAIAQARATARETYEDALEAGKGAILHEELLKGVHMLSVGHLRSGGEVIVTDTWTAFLSFIDEKPRLRIPVTVGEIYGRSPLSASDDLFATGRTTSASIAIHCESGTASLGRAAAPSGGRYLVGLDAPIDIVISGWSGERLAGVAADGRVVTLDVQPLPRTEGDLDLDVVFDRSGSMAEAAAGDEIGRSKYEIAKCALAEMLCTRIKPRDQIRLWEFNQDVRFVAKATGAAFEAVAGKLSPPDGGTEIGAALHAVIASKKTRDVLIMTDGKSWALDVQAIARAGLRITAVLIGEDALEANVAHLTTISGGQVFVAAGADAGDAIAAAFSAARSPHERPKPIKGNPTRVETLRRGARVIATWGAKTKAKASLAARQIGATAAMLAIPQMTQELATKLAEAEGIVTHLTSLVLLDETGERQEGIPARRKVSLARSSVPQTGTLYCIGPDIPFRSSSDPFISYAHRDMGSRSGRLRDVLALGGDEDQPKPPNPFDLAHAVRSIDWDADPEALRRADLSGLANDIVLAIRLAAARPEIIALADALGVAAVVVVIALLAQKASGQNRSAERLARAILPGDRADAVAAAMSEVGLAE